VFAARFSRPLSELVLQLILTELVQGLKKDVGLDPDDCKWHTATKLT